jgi:hypothetical protein
MADVAEGLETGDSLDVNSDAGFYAAVAKSAEIEVDPDTLKDAQAGDRTVDSGLETVEEPTEPVEAPEGDTPDEPSDTSDAEEAAPLHDDPDVAAFLEKYQGDTDAALKAAVEAQQRLGQQGNELGEERKRAQELSERLAKIEGRLEERDSVLPVANEQAQEAVEELFEKYGGPATADWIKENQPHLLDYALELWEDTQPARAAAWAARDAVADATPEPKSDEFVEGLKQTEQLRSTVDAVRATMNEQEWETVKVHLIPALQAAPELIQNAVVSADAKTQLQGVSALTELAKARNLAATLAGEQKQAESKEAKAKAVVVSGARSVERIKEAPAGSAEDTEAKTRAFYDALMKTETTSVRDGLTVAKA